MRTEFAPTAKHGRSTVVIISIAILALISSDAHAQAESLVAQWKLDEADGSGTDDATGRYPGTLMNGATWTDGRFGGAVGLDGEDDSVNLPNIDVGGSAMTIAAWVNHASFESGTEQRILSKASDTTVAGHYWTLGALRRRLRFRLKANGQTSTLVAYVNATPRQAWYHVAATYDGAAMRLYLNGVEVGRLAKSGSINVNPSVPVSMGGGPQGVGYLHGALDDVRLYADALTLDDIKAIMSQDGASDTQPPSAPSELAASTLTTSTVDLSWTASTDNTGVSGYRVYRNNTEIATTVAPAFSDQGLSESATYQYAVTAYDAAGNESPRSAAVTVTTETADTTPPAISNIQIGGVSQTSATISWNSNEPSGGRVDYGDVNYGLSVAAGSVNTSHSVVLSGLSGGTTYHFRVVSVDSAGNEARSPDGSFTTLQANGAPSSWQVAFTASSNHDAAVTSYLFEVFNAGVIPGTAPAAASSDLGKPAPAANGEIIVDRSSVMSALPAGDYIVTVTAIGPGGEARSEPVAFRR